MEMKHRKSKIAVTSGMEWEVGIELVSITFYFFKEKMNTDINHKWEKKKNHHYPLIEMPQPRYYIVNFIIKNFTC